MAAFAQFASDLDKASQRQLARGARLVEIMKQDQFVPMPFEKQVISIFAATNGYVDELAVHDVRRYESEMLAFIQGSHKGIVDKVRESKALPKDAQEELHKVLKDFAKIFVSTEAKK
jgi:F-type H+-transporting ATPase subunit alpha